MFVCLQNWLNLFGVMLKSSSSWVFKITRIEEAVTPSVFHPHSTSWSAPPFNRTQQLRQCLLLGSVEVTIKAIPPSNKKSAAAAAGQASVEVLLDVGYKQCLCIDLRVGTQGAVRGRVGMCATCMFKSFVLVV